MKKYSKSILSLVAAVVVAVTVAQTDGLITSGEYINIAIAAVTAAAVFTAPNVPFAPYTKSILAGLGAGLVLLASLATDGVTANELVQVAIVGLGAAGVLIVPNKDAIT